MSCFFSSFDEVSSDSYIGRDVMVYFRISFQEKFQILTVFLLLAHFFGKRKLNSTVEQQKSQGHKNVIDF